MRAATSTHRATQPLLRAATARRSASSAPRSKPFSPPSPSAERTTPFLPNGKAPASTLRSLVGLHHESANFMHDPSEIKTAFESTFRGPHSYFRDYDSYRASAIRLYDEHGVGGLENLATRSPGGAGVRRSISSGDDDLPDQAQVTRDVFRAPRSWTSPRPSPATELTERELKVKEAIFGTWERSHDGVPRPALDGVVDVISARGFTIQQAAKEWRKRDDEGDTEDGM